MRLACVKCISGKLHVAINHGNIEESSYCRMKRNPQSFFFCIYFYTHMLIHMHEIVSVFIYFHCAKTNTYDANHSANMNFLLSNKQSNFPFVFFMFAPFHLAALKKNLLFVNKQWASERKSSREMLYTWQESNKHDQQKNNVLLMCWRILNISALCLICQIYTIFCAYSILP